MYGKFFRLNEKKWGYLFKICPDCPFQDLAKRNFVSLKVDGMEVCPSHLFSLVQCKVYNERKKRLGDLQKKSMELAESIYKDAKPVRINPQGDLEFTTEIPRQIYYIDTTPQTKKFIFLENKENNGGKNMEENKIEEYLQEEPEEEDPKVKYLFAIGIICIVIMTILLLGEM